MLQDIIQAYDETYTPIDIESLSVVDLRETKRNLEAIIHQHEALVNSSNTNEDKDNRPTPVITHPPKKGKTSYRVNDKNWDRRFNELVEYKAIHGDVMCHSDTDLILVWEIGLLHNVLNTSIILRVSNLH